MARIEPGLAFSMPISGGHLVGLYTHDVPRIGSLVWIATPTFREEPTLDVVNSVEEWRWPALFPLAPALRRKLVRAIGVVPVPLRLQRFPTMRSGDKVIGWVAFTKRNGEDHLLGPTTDRSLPIYSLVNDTRLREMVETDWRPEERW